MPRDLWTPDEDRQLRRYRRRGMSHDEIGELLGRSASGVQTRLRRLGLLKSRRWPQELIDQAAALHGQLTAAQIGQRVGRSVHAVENQFFNLGLSAKRMSRPKRRQLERFIRRYHRLGWADSEISAAWCRSHTPHVSREWIGGIRRRLGLRQNRFSKHCRQRVAAKTREQLTRAGLKSLADVRAKAFADFAARHGWPGVTRPRAVQILDLLYATGPMTRREICSAIGMRWRGSRPSLSSNDSQGSYLANLVARGLVVCLGRLNTVHGKGRGRSTCKYAIAPTVVRQLPHPAEAVA